MSDYSDTEVVTWLQEKNKNARLTIDSREVQAGDIFVALKGLHVDALTYIPVVAARGAVAFLYEKRKDITPSLFPIPSLAVDNLKERLGTIAALFYGNPSAKMAGIAITGTNGKTSVSHWTAKLLSTLNVPTAAIGTIGSFFNGVKLRAPELTTPDAVSLEGLYTDLVQAGAKAFSVEASSIGLVQWRLKGSTFKTAVFTNLTRDHLDYHKTFEEYEKAKTLLFMWPGLTSAVINADDDVGMKLIHLTVKRGIRTIAYSVDQKIPKLPAGVELLYARDVVATKTGMQFFVAYADKAYKADVKALGYFNVANLLAVTSIALSLGLSLDSVVKALQTLKPPKGRLEVIERREMPLCVVDYCHTPDAIEKALLALREITKARGGKLTILLGAGGDRDAGKRPLMGEVAAKHADSVIVTSDNPRTEDPVSIARAVAEGAMAIKEVDVVVDRRAAIYKAVLEAATEDVVLVAGKGHEDYQEIQGVKQHFSDQEVLREALNERFVRKHST